MPAARPPGVTITRLPSTRGDSLSSQLMLRPPYSLMTFFCQTIDPSAARSEARSPFSVIAYSRSPSTVGVLRGPEPRSFSPAGPMIVTHATLPSARLRLVTTLCRLRIPCTQMRSPFTATDPYPAPSIEADHASVGPDRGHCLSSPVSFDTPLRSGPRHCGQSNDVVCARSDIVATITTLAIDRGTEIRTVLTLKTRSRRRHGLTGRNGGTVDERS